MGAWSHAPFANDDAKDFIEEVREDGLAAIANAFDVVNHQEANAYILAADASVAVAAASFVAASGGDSAGLPDEAAALMERLGLQGLRALRSEAAGALSRVLANSELRELWGDGDHLHTWEQSVRDLLRRLA